MGELVPQRKNLVAPIVAGIGFGTALGVALGAFALGPTVVGSGDGDAIREQFRNSVQEKQILEAQGRSANAVLDDVAGNMLQGTLTGRPVLVLSTSKANQSEVDTVKRMLKTAGADDAGTIKLTNDFFNQETSDKLKSLSANLLPAGASLDTKKVDASTHAGQTMGAALFMNPETTAPLAQVKERAALLQALRDAGLIDYQSGTILPAQAIVLVDGKSDGRGTNAYMAEGIVNFLQALDGVGKNVVYTANIETTVDTGTIGKLRADGGNKVSTVDSVNTAWARLATVMAVKEQLTGGFGAYGAADSADAAAPALSVLQS